MTIIQSSPEIAKRLATNIAISLDDLSDIGTITHDIKTTVAGNITAHQSMESLIHSR
nr:TIGR04197 family type VII secretion effector [Oceanobacillus timonensis]